MNFLCSECSTQLSKTEMKLNQEYPVGKLYCEFCQNKHERLLIQKFTDAELKDVENDLTTNNK